MSWLDKQVSLYNTHADNTGHPATVRDILFTEFAYDLNTIIKLRNLDREGLDYEDKKLELKANLQCFTPAGLLKTKKKGEMTELSRSGILQLDFDYKHIHEYDIEELKRCVFDLPFIGFCGLSCSGDGFYALALIAEPFRLNEYAEHLFQVFLYFGIKADQSKGKKVENLRYISYDANMLYRKEPEILRIKNFKTESKPKKQISTVYHQSYNNGADGLIKSQLLKIKNVKIGDRWDTVQKVAFTLGGIGDSSLIHAIKSEIEGNPEFNGQEPKYCKCAVDCFKAGSFKPLNKVEQSPLTKLLWFFAISSHFLWQFINVKLR